MRNGEVSYYFELNNVIYGPYSLGDMKAFKVFVDTPVHATYMPDNKWVLAKEISELRPFLNDLTADDPAEQTPAPEPQRPSAPKRPKPEPRREPKPEPAPAPTPGSTPEPTPTPQTTRTAPVQNTVDPIIKDFDINKDPKESFKELFDDFSKTTKSFSQILPKESHSYKKVFESNTAELEYYIETYSQSSDRVVELISKLTDISNKIQDKRDYVCDRAELFGESELRKILAEEEAAKKDCGSKYEAEIRKASAMAVRALEANLSVELHQIADEYRKKKEASEEKCKNYRQNVVRIVREFSASSFREVDKCLNAYNVWFNKFFSTRCEVAEFSEKIWKNLKKGNIPPAKMEFGKFVNSYELFGKFIDVESRSFISLFDNNNMVVKYDSSSKERCINAINSLITRSFASCEPGDLNLTMIDSDEMTGTSNILKHLNKDVFSLIVRSDDINRKLNSLQSRIENIYQNILVGSVDSLAEFNLGKEKRESYNLVVIKAFPAGFFGESLTLLKKIMKNGIRAGFSVIVLVDSDLVASSEDYSKSYTLLKRNLSDCSVLEFDFSDSGSDVSKKHFEEISDDVIESAISYVNGGVEETAGEIETIFGKDFVPAKEQWWSGRSASKIEIPFGIGEDKSVQNLVISQESGQNTAIVIGIPGSGKSVFLHSIILNAAINYSPNELNFYLLDFSGVEFNNYALHNLPHARVIAPEAEREFGISILNELKEEGLRRMALCRDNEVSSIVDLKRKRPDLVVPRLLVIIDEFQKLFEGNDAFSRDAQDKIAIIIQEYRKFGINLILATQQLVSGATVPRDLIANRIVFRAKPSDFSQLIETRGRTAPLLATGECIYNSQSGSEYDNRLVRSFFFPKKDIDTLLTDLSKFAARNQNFEHVDTLVFRSNDLPNYRDCKMAEQHTAAKEFPGPDGIGIYLGESIAISDVDVCAAIRNESNNNILVIGGEPDVAERIAMTSTMFARDGQKNKSASFYMMNFTESYDALNSVPKEAFSGFESVFPDAIHFASKKSEVLEDLNEIKAEIEKREATEDEDARFHSIYLSIYAFQRGVMFDQEATKYGAKVSESGTLLDFILKHGPMVGVHTIIQVDNLSNLSRIDSPLQVFDHKVVLQMSERDSNRLIDSPAASRLFVLNRPSSKFRAYYCCTSRNVLIKFKPYGKFDFETYEG